MWKVFHFDYRCSLVDEMDLELASGSGRDGFFEQPKIFLSPWLNRKFYVKDW